MIFLKLILLSIVVASVTWFASHRLYEGRTAEQIELHAEVKARMAGCNYVNQFAHMLSLLDSGELSEEGFEQQMRGMLYDNILSLYYMKESLSMRLKYYEKDESAILHDHITRRIGTSMDLLNMDSVKELNHALVEYNGIPKQYRKKVFQSDDSFEPAFAELINESIVASK